MVVVVSIRDLKEKFEEASPQEQQRMLRQVKTSIRQHKKYLAARLTDDGLLSMMDMTQIATSRDYMGLVTLDRRLERTVKSIYTLRGWLTDDDTDFLKPLP